VVAELDGVTDAGGQRATKRHSSPLSQASFPTADRPLPAKVSNPVPEGAQVVELQVCRRAQQAGL